MYEAEMRLPAVIGDYTDFYASIDHARNVGSMFRPNDPLLPNYKYVPIGYHGRASSIVPSETHVRRPTGQLRDDPEQPPTVAPTRRLDYEARARESSSVLAMPSDRLFPSSKPTATSSAFAY